MNKYRILEHSWFEIDKAERRSTFYIQERKSFLGIKWWSYVGPKVCYESGCYKDPLRFDSYGDANAHVKKLVAERDQSEFKRDFKPTV